MEYKKGHVGAEITLYTIMVNDRPLNMRGIVLEDFQLLYKELANKKSKLPVRLLRRFKQELYDFTLTNETTRKSEDTRHEGNQTPLLVCEYAKSALYPLSR
ncbi:MAG: hypothetical protein LUG93_03305 [Lachnospiraceae bacterium]|nr:hypothetical protein [Lachnospiraceae bacterium]